jgi:hypothetical protein
MDGADAKARQLSEVMETDRELANAAHVQAALWMYAAGQIANHDRAGFDATVARAMRELDTLMDQKAATE